MSLSSSFRIAALPALLLLACSDGGSGRDGAVDARFDTGTDAMTLDGSFDASLDAAEDAVSDGQVSDGQVSDGAVGEAYAHVVAVEATSSMGGYQLSVSVESADIDCTQYADWWEVLDESGALLYRRVLSHSHTDENGTSDPGAPGNTFTRGGGPVDIEADTIVIVRAHMNEAGYVGREMAGSPSTGFAEMDLPSDFAAEVETEEPQPPTCAF